MEWEEHLREYSFRCFYVFFYISVSGKIINKYSVRPHAAALAIEYLCSDEGAIQRAEGYARPTKTDVELPEEVQEKLLPSDMYESCTNVTDVEALNDACAEIAELWEKEVLPLVQWRI